MAGGEFRFGTASIYMAQRDNIQPNRTSQMRVITWTRFRRPQRHFLSTSAAFIVSARGKLGLATAQIRNQCGANVWSCLMRGRELTKGELIMTAWQAIARLLSGSSVLSGSTTMTDN